MIGFTIKTFILILAIGQQFGSPVDRSDSEPGEGDAGDSQDYAEEEDHSHLSEDHIHTKYEVLLSTIKEEYDEDEISIYESIRDENQDILTKIEKLYTAFKSHEHHHGHLPDIPLVSIVEQEPHTMTIMLKPKEVKPDTMVSLSYANPKKIIK